MPDWKININGGGAGGGAIFIPGVAGAKPGDPLEVMTDDRVTSANNTNAKPCTPVPEQPKTNNIWWDRSRSRPGSP